MYNIEVSEEANEVNQEEHNMEQEIPRTFKLDELRQKGVHKSGYDNLAGMKLDNDRNTDILDQPLQEDVDEETNNHNQNEHYQQHTPTGLEIGRLLLTRTSRRQRNFSMVNGDVSEAEVMEANGSVESIIDWAEKSKLDPGQRRAFEIFASTFILTFFNDPQKVQFQKTHTPFSI